MEESVKRDVALEIIGYFISWVNHSDAYQLSGIGLALEHNDQEANDLNAVEVLLWIQDLIASS
jgi:hypothetical protein